MSTFFPMLSMMELHDPFFSKNGTGMEHHQASYRFFCNSHPRCRDLAHQFAELEHGLRFLQTAMDQKLSNSGNSADILRQLQQIPHPVEELGCGWTMVLLDLDTEDIHRVPCVQAEILDCIEVLLRGVVARSPSVLQIALHDYCLGHPQRVSRFGQFFQPNLIPDRLQDCYLVRMLGVSL